MKVSVVAENMHVTNMLLVLLQPPVVEYLFSVTGLVLNSRPSSLKMIEGTRNEQTYILAWQFQLDYRQCCSPSGYAV